MSFQLKFIDYPVLLKQPKKQKLSYFLFSGGLTLSLACFDAPLGVSIASCQALHFIIQPAGYKSSLGGFFHFISSLRCKTTRTYGRKPKHNSVRWA